MFFSQTKKLQWSTLVASHISSLAKYLALNVFYSKNMKRNDFLLLLLIFTLIFISCSSVKYTASVKLNDIDSVIRIINPTHNCGCNWGDKTYKIYTGKSFSKNNYFWQSNYVKSLDSVDILNDSKKIKDQILLLEPKLSQYNRFFLEYRIIDNSNADTSIKYKVIGTWYSFKNNCSGFVKDINAEKLVKKTALDSYNKKLCKKS